MDYLKVSYDEYDMAADSASWWYIHGFVCGVKNVCHPSTRGCWGDCIGWPEYQPIFNKGWKDGRGSAIIVEEENWYNERP